MLRDQFLSYALLGIEPVLWILVAMSFVGMSVIIERLLVFARVKKNHRSMNRYTVHLVLEARLGILATFGNNAPFIGLFGTVLGVIQAFHAIGGTQAFDVHSIMQGISEALVATAAGLFVAIPCVMAYNYFNRRLKRMMIQHEAYEHDNSI